MFGILILFFIGGSVFPQKADSAQLNKNYKSLSEASKEPLKVYGIDLSGLPIDSFPIDLSKFKNLERLYLDYDHLEFIPREISDLENLKVLSLNGEEFKTIPPEFSKLKNLQVLFLNSDKKIDMKQSVDVLAKLPKLRTLHLEGDNLSALPENFSMLKIENLYLNNNNFSAIPLQVKDMKTLRYLDIRNNNVPALKKDDYKTFGFKIDLK
jgi:Leucine-rich repeat (LRR) protein